MDLSEIFNMSASVSPQTEEPIFVPILEKLIKEKNKVVHEPVTDNPIVRASSMGYCPRYILYQFRGYEEDRPASESFTLNTGTAFHEMIQEYLKGDDILLSLEEVIRYKDMPYTQGHYDGLLKIGNKKYLLEIKTCNVEAYQRLVERPIPYDKHKRQATFYMKALGVDETIFLYVNKNSMLLQEFAKYHPDVNPTFLEIRYRLDEAIHKDNIKFSDDIINHFKNGTLPAYKRVSQCNWCQFKEQCKEDRKIERKLERELEKKSE